MTVAELDRAPDPEVRDALVACCGARPWVELMLAARPWGNEAALLACADRCWGTLTHEQVAEAVAHHPRLGETRAAATLSTRASQWSALEQSGTRAADDDVRAELAQGNRDYEVRFGHTFILCASGLSAAEMLAALRARLGNDPATELRITALELHKITRLRLAKLLASA
ncbi:MAG: 2-oxo-4-hydroxy-4-carboxy-5-ureidoimidazoline decarboxylase [Candidatus Eisenbacteria bacterium]